jgi:hypothetical protein
MRPVILLFSLIPQLIILIVCIYYLTKKTSMEGMLLFMSSLFIILVSTYNRVILPLLIQREIMGKDTWSWLVPSVIAFSFLIHLAFAIAVVMLLVRVFRDSKN